MANISLYFQLVCCTLCGLFSAFEFGNVNISTFEMVNGDLVSTSQEALLPLKHSSGMYEEGVVSHPKRDSIIKETPITNLDVTINHTDLLDLECYNYHRYCTYEERQRTLPIDELKEMSLRTTFLKHSPNYCSCSADCVHFGDCCYDTTVPEISIEDDEEADVEELQEESEVRYTCLDLMQGYSYYVWSKCPREWVIQDVKKQCEKEHNVYSTNSQDYLTLMPVTSLENNVTYRNIFCAVCNDQKHLVPWKINLQCIPPPATFNNSITIPKNCPVYFDVPDELKSVEEETIFRCENNMQGASCKFTNSSDPADNLKARMCARYFAPVLGNTSGYQMMFKNKFCAFCNEETSQNLHCQSGTERNTPHHVYGSLTPHGTKTFNVVPSFSLILDIDFSSGGSVVGSTTRCSPGYVYDPFSNNCRSVVCGQNYVYSEGICIAKRSVDPIDHLHSRPITNRTPSLFDQCPKINVSETFEFGENETLILHDREMTLNKGEYQIQDNNTVVICADMVNFLYIGKFGEVQSYLTIVCISISIVCLFLKMVLFFVVPERDKIAPKAIACLSLTLFFGQLTFLIGRPEWGVVCSVIGIVTHYCFLVSFFWCNILAYDIWHTFQKSGTNNSSTTSGRQSRFCKYSSYAWVTPLIIVSVSVILNYAPFNFPNWNPRYGQNICWISNRLALLTFFAAPLAALLVVNLVFFGCTAFMIYRATEATKMAHENTGRKNQLKFTLYAKLALIMGLTWVFGFVAPFSRNNVVWCFFIVLNGLQGAFIFFAFTRFERVKRKLLRWSTFNEGSETSTSSGKPSEPRRLAIGTSNLATSNTNITNV